MLKHSCWLPVAAAALALLCGVSTGEAASMLHRDGDELSVANGRYVLNFMDNGSVSSFSYKGQNLTRDRAIDRLTFYLDYHAKGKTYPIVPDEVKVYEDTDDTLHFAFIDHTGLLGLEYHYRIRRGESGMHCYVIARNNTQVPLKLSELRTVYRVDRKILNYCFNGNRKGLMPSQAEMRRGKKLQDETYDMGMAGYKYTNSNIYEKYDFSNYLATAGVWGDYGHGYGFWVIPMSNEYHPGGPLKQDLTVHYDSIIINPISTAHYGTGDYMAPVGWQKLYGPWYVYVNEGTPEQVIADAQKQARLQEQQWPCRWMQEPLYPTARGSVTGQLMLGNQAAAGAQIVLAKPGYDYYHDRSDYVFAAVADQKGRFSVPAVRPGNYVLQAYMQGGSVTDTFVSQPFAVGDKGAELKTLTWQPPQQRVLWQIGTADHRADEFVYGGAERNYIWMTKVPENLTYIVGKSKADKDWYYAQTKPGDWNIDFQLTAAQQAKGGELQVALAGYSTGMGKKFKNAHAELLLNGQKLQDIQFENDQTVYRCGTSSGTYHLVKVPLSAAQLKAGENKLTIHNQGASLLYDTILMVQKK
ncbi:MAG: polysaccharide lyase family protein [Selenomonadaceae bacterium]|nr:polysaccharide lyase family protein [Selenomonadaceae bacterium]